MATNSRKANKETLLPRGGGPDGSRPILVPKGTMARWSSHALHRDKAVFGADADEFRPERWDADLRVRSVLSFFFPPSLLLLLLLLIIIVNAVKANRPLVLTKGPLSWEYIPFSGGPRICPGQQFALTQIAFTLFEFFRTFRTIEAQDSGPLLAQTNLTISFPHGCLVNVTRG